MKRFPGEVVGKFQIVRHTHNDSSCNRMYLCICKVCGEHVSVRADKLKTLKHCQSGKKHTDDIATNLKNIWNGIMKNHSGEVCKEWEDFNIFLINIVDTIGVRQDPAHVLTRIDVSKEYAPGNVEWNYFYGVHNKVKDKIT